jgi:branched-chain amino acid aminotransferase
VLASITRDRLMRAVPGIEEGAWTLDEVKAADEAFLASTTRELQAVASIDGAALPAAPGPRTRAAQEAFAAARDAELEATAD